MFVVPWGGEGGAHRFTYIGTTDTDYDGPLDDPQITADDVAYLLRRDQRRGDDARSPKPTSSARGPGCGRWSRRPRASAPPTSRAATRCTRRRAAWSRVTGGKLTTYRRMAADAVDQVMQILDRQRPQPDQARAPARRRRLGRARTSRSELGERYGADARDGARARARRSRPRAPARSRACRTRAPRSCTRCAPRWRARVDDVLSRRTRARLLGRDAIGRRGRRRRRAHGRRARLVGRRARPPGRALPRRWSTRSAAAGGLPETALDALLAAARPDAS